MTIPKIIHYCWFGGKPIPDEVMKYIDTWKHYLPDYEIKEWNESNFDISSIPFVKEAYEYKKYAFVSDYVRLYALKTYGGLYFDVDIQVLKPIDSSILAHDCVFCFESKNKIMTAFMASIKEHDIINEFLDLYKDKHFDNNNIVPNTDLLTQLLSTKNFIIDGTMQEMNNIKIYPNEYFNGFDFDEYDVYITNNTYTVHHFLGSWCSPRKKFIDKTKKILRNVVGKENYLKLKSIKKKVLK